MPFPRPIDGPAGKSRTLGDLLPASPGLNAGPLNVGGITLGDLANVSPEFPKGHKGLFPGKDWKTVLGAVSDGLLAYSGRPTMFAPLRARQMEQEEERNFAREKLDAQLEADRLESLRPKFEQIGNTGGMFDPTTMSYNPIFTAPQPFEIYAQSLGLQPGTDAYREAIQEYRAGTWGEEGVAGRLAVQAPRLEVSRENNIRSTSTSRGNNIRSNSQSNVNSVRSAETARGAHSYSNGSGRGGGKNADLIGPVHSKGNQRIQFNRNLGAWVDLATGKPVQ